MGDIFTTLETRWLLYFPLRNTIYPLFKGIYKCKEALCTLLLMKILTLKIVKYSENLNPKNLDKTQTSCYQFFCAFFDAFYYQQVSLPITIKRINYCSVLCMLKVFQVVHVTGTSRVSFRFTHKSSKRNFTRLKFIKNIRIIPGYFKAHDKFNQIQFLSQWLSEDKNKFHLKWIKKNESKVLCGFFCPWWRMKKGTFLGETDTVGVSICYLKI